MRAYAQDIVLKKTRIDVRYAARAIRLEIVPLTLPLASANTLTTRQRNKSWHLTAIRSKDPPRASVNSSQTRQGNRAGTWLPLTSLRHLQIPLRARQRHIELAPNCRTIAKRPPLWHQRTPLRTRQRHIELAPNCYMIIRPLLWHLRIPL